MSNAKVVVSISSKGGVGKTTLLGNLGTLLALRHKKVLFVDLDYQGNLTSCFKNLSDSEKNKSCMIRAYKHDAKDISAPFPNDFKPAHISKYIDIFTANRELDNVSNLMKNKSAFSSYVIIHMFSKMHLINKYDYILIDCHNSINLLSQGALVEADKMITPVTPSRFAFDGIQTMMKTIKDKTEDLVNPVTQKSFIDVGKPLLVGNLIDFNTRESHEFIQLIHDNPDDFVAGFHKRALFSRATTNYTNVFKLANEDAKKGNSRNKNALENEIIPNFDKLIKAIDK